MSTSQDARCEDERVNSVGMLWRAGKQSGINEQTGNGAKRRNVCHLAGGILSLQRFSLKLMMKRRVNYVGRRKTI